MCDYNFAKIEIREESAARSCSHGTDGGRRRKHCQRCETVPESIQQCCCGPARGGRTIGQHERKLAIDPRSYRTDRKCSAPDQHDAVTAGDHSADGDGHSWGDGHLHRSAVSIDPGLPRRKAAVADTAHDLDQRRGERSSNPLRDSIGSVYVRFRAIARVRRKAFLDASVRSRNPRGWPVFASGIRTNFIAAFAQLKKNKMTNPTALMLLKDISWYYPYRTAIARASMGLKSGESLANVLAAETDIIGERNIQYFRFIEETGSDVDQLERLAILMNRDLDADTERFRTILNPLILIVLAVVVGMIAAAIILPMYEIYNHI